MRKGVALLLAFASLLSTGCAAARRGAEDAAVVGTLPVHILATPAGILADGWKEDGAGSLPRTTLLLPLAFAGDLLFTGVSAVDLALTPAYAPFRVERLRFYDLSSFPTRLDRRVGEDAGTAALQTVQFLAPIGAFVLLWTGRGEWNGPGWPDRPQSRVP